MEFHVEPWGELPSGEAANLFTLKNDQGTIVKLTDFGAIVVAVETVDRSGNLANITLGFDSLGGYQQRHPYFGSTVGRFCNRIARGAFELDGTKYTLARNDGEHHLHGGEQGFDRAFWSSEKFSTGEEVGVAFTSVSPDGDEGYPGNLSTTAKYSLSQNNELRIHFTATTDQPTPLNLTNHCYWNLSGAGSGTILHHEVELACEQFLPVDDSLIPTGALAPVDGTPLDFRQSQSIGKRITEIDADPQGYDHCYVVPGTVGTLRQAARVVDPTTGRTLLIKTTQPGIQLYTGNFLDGAPENGSYPQYGGFCLETQHFPDSPNQPNFPSTILRPGEQFDSETLIEFGVQ